MTKILAGFLMFVVGGVSGYLIGMRHNPSNQIRVFSAQGSVHVRRAFAVPGDWIEVKASQVYLNGKPLTENERFRLR